MSEESNDCYSVVRNKKHNNSGPKSNIMSTSISSVGLKIITTRAQSSIVQEH